MRTNQSKIEKIISLIKKVPCFSLDDLSSMEQNKNYLKILLSRYEKASKLVRLKKGIYTSKEYIYDTQKNQTFFNFLEFLANFLRQPSYLSLDYVLYEHNILTEVPVNFTSVAKNKTIRFSNSLGNFSYHKVKERLFSGFKIIRKGDFIILKASKSKALFDFLYLRKNLLPDQKAVRELRLNLDNFSTNELKELKSYYRLEGSKKMKKIINWLFK